MTSETMTGLRGSIHSSILKGESLEDYLRIQMEKPCEGCRCLQCLDCATARLPSPRPGTVRLTITDRLMEMAVLLTASRIPVTLHAEPSQMAFTFRNNF